MAFVRKKRVKPKNRVKGYEYYQLVENYRENGKVRQRMLAHLGRYPTLEAAIEAHSNAAKYYKEESRSARAIANRMYREYREGVYDEWFRRGWLVGHEDLSAVYLEFRDIHHAWRERAADAQRRGTVSKQKLEKLRQLKESGKG